MLSSHSSLSSLNGPYFPAFMVSWFQQGASPGRLPTLPYPTGLFFFFFLALQLSAAKNSLKDFEVRWLTPEFAGFLGS